MKKNHCSRRRFLQGSATAVLAGWSTPPTAQAVPVPPGLDVPDESWRIQHGRIRQSVMAWCFNPMPMEQLIDACHRMGLPAMEGLDRRHYPALRARGMVPGIVGSHGFATGPVNRDHHPEVIAKLREGIDVAAAFGARQVITFTGMRERGIPDAAAARNCVDAWQQVIGHAEARGINVCLEHLNSRDDTHPMKGHPGYFGDDVDFCVELIRRVGSPRMKLLFDIYHVQIMNGDVIRRLRQHRDVIAHIHTAGVPGRGELDDTQEVNYPAIMRAIVELEFQGLVAQEFIPTWDDPLAALRHAVRQCDV